MQDGMRWPLSACWPPTALSGLRQDAPAYLKMEADQPRRPARRTVQQLPAWKQHVEECTEKLSSRYNLDDQHVPGSPSRGRMKLCWSFSANGRSQVANAPSGFSS